MGRGRWFSVHGVPEDPRARARAPGMVLARFLRYLRAYRALLAWSLFLLVVGSLLQVIPPWIIRSGVNEAVSNQWVNPGHFVRLGALFVGLHLVLGATTYVQTICTRRAELGVVRDLRNDVFRHLQSLPLKFYDNRQTGEIMSRILNDVNRLEVGMVEGFLNITRDVAVFGWLLAFVLYLNWKLTLLAVAVVPVMAVGTYYFNLHAHLVWRRIREKMADISVAVNENITGTRAVKAFAREERAIEEFEGHTDEGYRLGVRAAAMMAGFTQLVSILNALGTAMVLGVGGYMVYLGTMQVGDLVAFFMYVGMLYAPINSLVRANYHIQRAAVAGERVFDLLDTAPEIADAPDAVELASVRGHVVFDNVTFAYDRRPVLRGISLEVRPGEVIAIVGPSGAGKTSLVQLIPRLYEPTSGRVIVDGHDVRSVTAASLRRKVAVVSQDVFLFSGTIGENILYGRPEASEEEMLAAARAAHVHEFVERLPQRYDTPVGERGVKLSEGQKQRVAIARALLKDAPILILDEPTSNVDTESERLIQESLDRLMHGRTTFVIAHRLTTIVGATRIVVIENGRIRAVGSHAELFERDELYRKLYSIQFDYAAFKRRPRNADG